MVTETCLICNKKFEWEEVIVVRIPEYACFCLCCGAKFPNPSIKDKDINQWIIKPYRGKQYISSQR